MAVSCYRLAGAETEAASDRIQSTASGLIFGYHCEAFQISERYVPIMLIAIGKAAKSGHPKERLAVEDDVAFFNEMT
ncbi:hypothetical protein J14TS5_49770 [Paenibacillus lautus]|nr:hypothetical protein J14TS5_49770 [Paenibacillus lautus]